MNADELALLHAIAASPADDLPLLVYADWLDEHGFGIRAEFIRVACELAELEPQHNIRGGRLYWLRDREVELLKSHAHEFFGPLANLPSDVRVEYARGFITKLEMRCDRFVEWAERISRVVPLPKVAVDSVFDTLAKFMTSRHLNLVTDLELAGQSTQNGVYEMPEAESLAAVVPQLNRLESLSFNGLFMAIMRDGSQQAPSLPLLRPIDFPSLNRLNLAFTDIQHQDITYLLDVGLLQRLQAIRLSHTHLGDETAQVLAERISADGPLVSLELDFTDITDAGEFALASRFGDRVHF